MVLQVASGYSTEKSEFYSSLEEQAAALVDPSLPLVSNLSNLASLLYWAFHDKTINRPINWVGFYLATLKKPHTLVLGPFHGRIACTMIHIGKGVCGTCAIERRPILVANVDEFSGHIACDSLSKSELVLPLVHADGRLLGVLDLDSTVLQGFDNADLIGLESVVQTVLAAIESWTFE
ncbi:hypothetical protein BDV3_005801 [Batrachochytrium dendrobatidis]